MSRLRNPILLAAAVLSGTALCILSFSTGHAARAAAPAGPGGAPGQGRAPGRGPARGAPPADTGPRSLSPYFTPISTGLKPPDADGFLQRWLLLEPMTNGLRGNTGFTDSYVHNAFKTLNFPDNFSTLPKDGDKLNLAGQDLTWHALDSTNFNVKLFRLAYGLNKTVYGVTFLAQTIVESPRDIENVRLAVGSNSASIWWVNGKEAVGLFGDRRMVMDDGVSRRLTLKKGANLIQGAVINGPGMSDFCVRFIDEQGEPVKDIAVDLAQ